MYMIIRINTKIYNNSKYIIKKHIKNICVYVSFKLYKIRFY